MFSRLLFTAAAAATAVVSLHIPEGSYWIMNRENNGVDRDTFLSFTFEKFLLLKSYDPQLWTLVRTGDMRSDQAMLKYEDYNMFIGKRWLRSKIGLVKGNGLIFDLIPGTATGEFQFRTTDTVPLYLCAPGHYQISLSPTCTSFFRILGAQGEILPVPKVEKKQQIPLEDGHYFIINRDAGASDGKYMAYSQFWRRLKLETTSSNPWKLVMNPTTGYYTIMSTCITPKAHCESQHNRVIQSRWFRNIGLSDFDATSIEIIPEPSKGKNIFCLRTIEFNYIAAKGTDQIKLSNQCTHFEFVQANLVQLITQFN